jgi:hypothetical protein
LWRVPLAGGDPVRLARTIAGDLIVRDGTLYGGYSECGALSGGIWRVPTSGGDPASLPVRTSVVSLAVDDVNAYWSHGTSNRISATPLDGGDTMVVVDESFAWQLETDGTSVYWLSDDGAWKAPVGGGSPIPVGPVEKHVGGIAVDASHVYWASWGDAGGAIRRAPK